MNITENKRLSNSAKKYLLSLSLFALILATSLYLVWQFHALQENERDSSTQSLLSSQAAQIERNLTIALTSTYILSKDIKDNNGVVTNFDQSAATILQLIPGATNIQLAPGGVNRHVFPLEGNEAAIGHDILRDENRNAEALKAIYTQSLTLAGPFELIQGGLGMVGRNPIFIDSDDGVKEFWGFATALILLDDLLEQAGFCKLLCEAYNYELAKYSMEGDGELHVFASGGNVLSKNALTKEIMVPNGTWLLRIEPKNTGNNIYRFASYAICVLFSLVLSYCSLIILKEPEKLRNRVDRQTQELHDLAYKDALTGLPNRRMFGRLMREHLTLARNNNSALDLLLIDLDRFKDVNDTLGHDVGDLLLCSVGTRLKNCLPDSAHLARLGGDEFTIILHSHSSPALAQIIAQSIISELSTPFVLNGNSVYAASCIGIATLSDPSLTATEMHKHADLALYEAKSKGSGQFVCFSKQIAKRVERAAWLTNDLKTAVRNNELELLYQPIFNANTGIIEKVEALLRWHHPVLGDISPMELIPLAERSGLIEEIGLWVFETAATQAKLWDAHVDTVLQISINVSPDQIRSREQITAWFRILKKLELDGSRILIEITEGTVLEGGFETDDIFKQLQINGIEVALDDFGTGYSSMAYLRQFDIDYLKIDRSFVQNLPGANDDLVLCQAIIAIASKLGLRVVAEGVETDDQRQILTREGCDFLQGYGLSRPVDVQKFDTLYLPTIVKQEAVTNQTVLPFKIPGKKASGKF